MAKERAAVVLGVGPGLGEAAAKRFAAGGFTVALMARGADGVARVRGEIERDGGRALDVTCDAGDPDSVARAFARVRDELGDPEVLVYNAGAFVMGGVLELPVDGFESAWRVNCLGGFLAAREVLPAMVARGKGTVIFTGATASMRGGARFAGLAVGKFGLRALAQSMARELGPKGIHVAHVVIDGQIDTPQNLERFSDRPRETFLSASGIADTYFALHQQDPTTWTHELDLRPATEKF